MTLHGLPKTLEALSLYFAYLYYSCLLMKIKPQILLFFLTAMFLHPLRSSAFDLQRVRREFYAAVNDKKSAEALYKKLGAIKSSDPLYTAYYGSAKAVMAKHAWNPYRKLDYLKSGLQYIEDAVRRSPDNLEIRFLRFSIEYYLPSFLGMSKHLDEDGKKMLGLIESNRAGIDDPVLLKNIVDFLKKSGRYNARELAALNGGGKNE